jgi:uncharacterized NAD(P)/FAD-binding protein YdhS
MTIVIIGGGFSGAVTAVHLLRSRARGRRRVVLVNRSGAMARGVAYGTRSEQHVLNVPAGRMSAFEDDPESFVRFVQHRGLTLDGAAFVRRDLYGEYLESLLRDAADRAPSGTLERRVAEVSRIDLARDGAAAWVTLTDGPRILADRVVLAIGNYPPQHPDLLAATSFWTSRRYVSDPWRPDAFATIDPDRPMLCLGTGLTMIDVVLERRLQGARGGFVAVSRRGLLPMPHRASSAPPDRLDLPIDLFALASATARGYCRTVRHYIRAAAERGVDWRDVIGALRPITPALWHALSVEERRRWLRHVRPFWEVHRHRLAPQAHEAFHCLLSDGQARILAARLIAVREEPEAVVVSVRPRGSCQISHLTAGSVVNCTGPAGDTRRLVDPLFASLCGQGLLRPDPLGLGIDTSSTGAVLGRDGQPVPTLYYVGPFLRARDWEATAVPELRRHARQLADHLLECSPARTSSTAI